MTTHARDELHQLLLSLVDPTALTEQAFADQDRLLRDLCQRMSLEELLEFGFERRLGRGQAITLLKRFKNTPDVAGDPEPQTP